MTRKMFFFAIALLACSASQVFCAQDEGKSQKEEGASEEDGVNKDTPDSLQARKKHNQVSISERRIYPVNIKPNVIYQLQTALGYASTIELPEPALKVFVGDQDLFKVGVYEKEVLVKPATDQTDARTNLTIITQNARLTIDLSVGDPETADFVLDFRFSDPDALVENAFQDKVEKTEAEIKEHYQKKEEALDEKAKELSQEKLKEEVRKESNAIQLKASKEEGGVCVTLLSLSVIGERAYLRFNIRNSSAKPYKIREAFAAVQTYEKKLLGLRKEKEGIIQIPSELKIDNPIPPGSSAYGVLQFERRALKNGEKPVFLLFEEEGKQDFKIEGFRWLA